MRVFRQMSPLTLTVAVFLECAGYGWGQTKVDLGGQGRNYDFSAADSTRPVKTGYTLPPTCAAGQLFYSLTAAPGANLYGCTSPNTWTLQSWTASNLLGIISSDGSVNLANVGSSVDLSTNPAFVATASGNSDLTGTNKVGLGGSGFVSITMPNETIVGTALYSLASVSAGLSSAVLTSVGAATGVVGLVVSGAGTTGNARIAIHGFATCNFDGATHAGDYVQASLTAAGQCTDAGPARPGSRQVLGYATTSNIGAGSYPVLLAPDVVGAAGGNVTARSELHLPLTICAGVGHPVLAWNIPPAPAVAATAGGCSGANVADGYASFTNTGTPSLQMSVTLPQTLTGPADVYLNYFSSTASGTFAAALDVTCEATDGRSAPDAAWTPNNFFAPGAPTTPEFTGQTNTLALTGISWPSGCTAGSRAHFRLIRGDTSGTAGSINISEVIVVFRRTL